MGSVPTSTQVRIVTRFFSRLFMSLSNRFVCLHKDTENFAFIGLGLPITFGFSDAPRISVYVWIWCLYIPFFT